MKTILCKVTALVATLSIGMTISSLIEAARSPFDYIPPVTYNLPSEVIWDLPYRYAIISVPADDAFYLGKQRIRLSQLCESVEQQAVFIKPSDRILVIKSDRSVRFESLYRLLHKAEECKFANIKFVIDKKKIGRV